MADSKGYVLLFSVIVVGAIAALVASSFLIMGLDYGYTSSLYVAEKQARVLADTCAEIALEKLKESVTYAGNETITFPAGEYCIISPVGGSGTSNRTVQAQGFDNNLVRKVKVEVSSTSPQMTVSSWQEVSDF